MSDDFNLTSAKQLPSGKGRNELQLNGEVLPQPPAYKLSRRDVAAMIFRRRRLALLLFGGIFLTVAVVTVLQPSFYMARAKLLFKKERASTVVSAQAGADGDAARTQISEEMLNSELEIIDSTTLLREVLREDRLYYQIINPESAGQLDSSSALEIAVSKLKADLDCQIVPKSNIIQVSYEAKDPQLAAQIVNALCQRYVVRHLEVHETKGIYSFFQKQSEVLHDTLQAMTAALQRFETENDLMAPEQQRQLFLQKLADSETQRNLNRANLQASSRQVDFLEKQIAAAPERIQTQNQQVSSTVNEALADQLESLKLKYDLMVQTEKNPAEPKSQLARSLKSRIAQIEETIHQQQQRIEPPQVSTDINQAMADLTAQLTRARVELIGYQERDKELTAAIAQAKQDLKNLEGASFKHEAMVRQLELIQNNYLLYAKKQEEARISEALDREKVANVSIVDPASVPLEAVRPNRKLNIAMGFALALFVSLGTCLGLGFLDVVIHSRSDIERQINVPVIVSIPDGQWPLDVRPASMLELQGFPEDSK